MKNALWGLALLAACSGGADGAKSEGKILVTATTGMVADLARVVGGDDVVVRALMGPGVDPHLYKASAQDLDRLREADLILYSGLNLEGKMADVFVSMARRGKTVVAVTETIPEERRLEPPELEGHYDPHVWFDVSLWAEAVAPVAEALSQKDPSKSALFRDRAAAYRAELLKLHEEVKAAIATVPKERRLLVTSHDAFRYFGRAYDIEVTGLQGISTVTEAGVADVQRVVDLVTSRKVKAVFIETSVNPKAVEAVRAAAKRQGHEVAEGGTLYSDAMGDRPPEDTYVGMVRANVNTIVGALR
jgi:manganese/zinc/iron transport system substrate-binding protein